METNEKQNEAIKRIKSLFMAYFDGAYRTEPQSKTPLCSLMITDLKFTFKSDEEIDLSVTLGRPGLLIGKMGRTIDAVEAWLSTPEYSVKISIIESKLWHI